MLKTWKKDRIKYPHKNGKKYKVHIEEIKVTTVTVKARNLEEAEKLAKEMYKNGDIILNGKDFTNVSIQAEGVEGNESGNWRDV